MMHALTEFLQAKFPLDQRSLNPDVWRAFVDLTAYKRQLNLLDVGTGTGSMLRRLLQAPHAGLLSLTGLDQEAELLKRADCEITALLEQNGFNLIRSEDSFTACNQQNSVAFRPVYTPLSGFESSPESYCVITAHAFMDLVPLEQSVLHFKQWLKPGGLFYSTLNYDGETVLFPPYHDTDFETQILAEYNASMERRRIVGLAAGGAKCGRRLYQILGQTGFSIMAYGSSDWNITPIEGNYRDADQVVLRYLLQWIFGEAAKRHLIDATKLAQWHQCRQDQLTERTLGIIIHQLDILAQKA